MPKIVKLTPITIRVPENDYELIKLLSEQENRSINAQIITLLQEALAQRQRKSSDKANN